MQKYQNNVTSRTGDAVSGLQVTVSLAAGGLATIYSDNAGTPKDNPLTTDANGYFEFYTADGRYNITVNGGGYDDVLIADALLIGTEASTASAKADSALAGLLERPTSAALAASGGAALVGWQRNRLSAAVQGTLVNFDSSFISPWENLSLAVVSDPDDPRTWDWTAALQKCIDDAFSLYQGGIVFNNGKSASMQGVNLCGVAYGISGQLSLPDGGGSGGAGGEFWIANGGLTALAGFPAGAAMLRPSSSDTFDWVQNIYVSRVDFDGNNMAEVCIDVQKSVGVYIDWCHVCRYTTRGIQTSNLAFNTIINHCYIERFPFGTVTPESVARASAAEYGVYFGNSDSMLSDSTVIGNTYGVGMAGKTRVIGNHIYGNKYSLKYDTQYGIVTGNYIEDPILATALRDITLMTNFFSESNKGAAIIVLDDSSGNVRGSSVIGNTRAGLTLSAAGNLTFGATTGLTTVTSTANDFFEWVATAHVPDGAIITAGGAYAVVVPDAANTQSTVAVRIVGMLSGTAFAAGAWTHAPSFIALTGADQTVSPTAVIQHTSDAINNQGTVRLSIANAGAPRVTSRNYYDWTQGDGRGDFFIGNASSSQAAGIGFGVVNAGVNRGISSIWARGAVENIYLGGFTTGTYLRLLNDRATPGTDNAYLLGELTRRWRTVYAMSISSAVATISTSTTLTTSSAATQLANATSEAITVNLPTAASANGLTFNVKKIDASVNTVTIDPNGAETIDGAATLALTAQWQSARIQSNGTAWFVL